MDRLDAAAIDVPGVLVRVVAQCPSTNTALLQGPPSAPVLLAAESQTAGRGRRGRRWHSAPGSSITFSLARRVRRPQRELAGLSLVAGVAAARALRGLGAPVRLKWPNDLLAGEAKLGGILVETRSPSFAVIGIGLNYLAEPALASRVRRPLVSLSEVASPLAGRNAVIQAIGRALVGALDAFEAGGLASVRDEWLSLDAYAGQRLRLRMANGRSVTGVSAGLADDGALCLRTRGGVRAFRSGTVRLLA
ncbi:MAG TPA: biotin--[acetyl-CoA-carboxylase] ligase [Gemmatimonadaceae bacterium]|nr:biotin--[acetyl-CoA-carboxylase] ligase [Gemmatimonadaceae bacterium]